MKKKLLLIITTCLCVFGLAACGTDPTTVDYNGYTYDQLQTNCQTMVKTLESLSEADIENNLENGTDEIKELVNSWSECRADLGDFIGFGEFTVTKSGKTLTAEQEAVYQERPLVLTYVYNYNSMEVQDVTVDLVYTTGEKMQKAGLNTIMCITIVFVVLILISLIIYAFNIIPILEKKFSSRKKSKEPETVSAVPAETAAAVQTDDNELIAVIAAAIAAASGTSTDDFVVRSIRRR